MAYKEYSDSYLMTMTKQSIIRQLRCAEHNFRAAEQTLAQQAENVKGWEPVRHARWVVRLGPVLDYQCSECSARLPFGLAPSTYFPNCGAKMDLGAGATESEIATPGCGLARNDAEDGGMMGGNEHGKE